MCERGKVTRRDVKTKVREVREDVWVMQRICEEFLGRDGPNAAAVIEVESNVMYCKVLWFNELELMLAVTAILDPRCPVQHRLFPQHQCRSTELPSLHLPLAARVSS